MSYLQDGDDQDDYADIGQQLTTVYVDQGVSAARRIEGQLLGGIVVIVFLQYSMVDTRPDGVHVTTAEWRVVVQVVTTG